MGDHFVNSVLEGLILNKALSLILLTVCILKKSGLNFILFAAPEVGKILVGFGRKIAGYLVVRSGLRYVLGELSVQFLLLVIVECIS